MNYTLSTSSVFPLVEVTLNKGEDIRLEAGAMVYHAGGIKLQGKMNSNGHKGIGGAMRALGRAVTSGESFFITTAHGEADGAQIALAPSTPGAIKELTVGAEHWRLNTGAFLACEESVSYNMVRQNLSGALFGGTGGLYVMETSGTGALLISAFGDLKKIELDGSTPFTVDNQHVVAWSSSLDYKIKVASGTFGFKTGEGLVNEFTGSGTIYIQSRNLEALAHDLTPFIDFPSQS
ncbi:MAG: TIGR00266 family protein [Enterococcus sp.]